MSLSPWAETIFKQKYSWKDAEGNPTETWEQTARRVVENVVTPYLPQFSERLVRYITDLKFLPGGRYLYAAGKEFHQTQNCLLLRVGDSREEWADLMRRITSGLMTGAGVGVVYSDLRPKGAAVKGMGGVSTGPLALMQMVNEAGRHIMQGGSRRAAMWAGLHWDHEDVFDFIRIKNWSEDVQAMKAKDFNAPAAMDSTNISVILDDKFFAAYEDPFHPQHDHAHKLYLECVELMLTTGEPGFSVDVGENAGEHLRNACTEITSRDDNDICNLGSINMARVKDQAEFAEIVQAATAFLLCGTLYSKVPYEEVAETRTKNRRLGLGLMGIYEWLAVRGKPYAPDKELGQWLVIYEELSRVWADLYADTLGISRPIKLRALAPTGTIGIIAGTTTAAEPMFAAAYQRRYLKGDVWHAQRVIEPFAARMAELGIDPDTLESAYDLAKDPARRLEVQAWIQEYVDHGISSTLNLPAREDQPFTTEEFGDTLMRYLPRLRGVTVYPDGARGGQPLTVIPYADAVGWEGVEFEEVGNGQACVSGVCGV